MAWRREISSYKTRPTKRSQNGTQKVRKFALFFKNYYSWRILAQMARRSLVENDGLLSFQGAPDWRVCAAFMSIFLALAES